MADIDEKTIQELIDRARQVSKHAYCPYSGFPVGAAVLSAQGNIFAGCNVENASLGLTICAERSAVFHMIAEEQRRLIAVAIYTPTPTPHAPCGACRQVINEFGPRARLISVCDGPDMLRLSLAELLPRAFGPTDLE